MNRKFRFDRKQKTVLLIGCVLVTFYVLVRNFPSVAAVLKTIVGIISPFLWGIAVAYLLNLLMEPIENKLFAGIKSRRLRRSFSLTLTVIIALALLSGFFYAMMPQLVDSVTTLVENFSQYADSSEQAIVEWVEKFGLSGSIINDLFGTWDEIGIKLLTWIKKFGPEMLNITKKVGAGVFNSIISLFTAIYILIDREELLGQCRNILRAIFNDKVYDRLSDIATRSNRAFSSFLVGKIIDSAIIGIICFIGMMIFKMPYSMLISVIVGVTNLIPTFGPLVGGVVGAFIILIVDPSIAIGFALLIILLQQFDGNILGPAILGDAVGLSALWILIAVVVCGSLWGIVGMFVGVPLVAVFYDLVSEFITEKLFRKGLDANGKPISDSEPATVRKKKKAGFVSKLTEKLIKPKKPIPDPSSSKVRETDDGDKSNK